MLETPKADFVVCRLHWLSCVYTCTQYKVKITFIALHLSTLKSRETLGSLDYSFTCVEWLICAQHREKSQGMQR